MTLSDGNRDICKKTIAVTFNLEYLETRIRNFKKILRQHWERKIKALKKV